VKAERYRVEPTLKHEDYALLVANIPDVISRFDRNLRWAYVSPSVERYTGLKPAQIVGRTHQEIGIPADTAQALRADLARVFETATSSQIEFSLESPAMGLRHFHSLAVPELDADQQVCSVLTITRDITELSTALETIQLANERLRRAQDVGKVASWEWSLATGEIEFSENAPEVFNRRAMSRSLEEFVSRVHADDRHLIVSSIERAQREQVHQEYRVIDDNGEVRWIQTRTRPLHDRSGKVTHIVGATQDITAARMAELALLESEKLATAGRLSATVAHEINNPLEAVTNLLYLARENESVPSDVRDLLEQADTQLRRVAHIVRQTLGFYREQTASKTFSLKRVANQTLDIYAAQCANRQITTDVVGEDVQVYANEGEVRQVISNILSNAIDASRGGRIMIEVRRVADYAELRIADDGPGIPPEIQARIFEPFFTTKKDYGTGLGLWVCKELVEKAGGSIWIEPNEPHGTVVAITLPVDPGARTTSSQKD
jgi:PAS domain S-box-containing protein